MRLPSRLPARAHACACRRSPAPRPARPPTRPLPTRHSTAPLRSTPLALTQSGLTPLGKETENEQAIKAWLERNSPESMAERAAAKQRPAEQP